MRYMLLVCADAAVDEDEGRDAEQEASPADMAGSLGGDGQGADEPCWAPWAALVQGRGVRLLDGAMLHPVSAATTVRARDGEVLVTDGPFAETKEQIVGYDVIECADLDAAIETAAAHPVVQAGGLIEIRPIMPADD